MKNKIYLLLAILVLGGVGCGIKEEPAIVIDDIKITKAEFEDAFAASRFASMSEGKKAFLESYINKKLILKEAENMGLDKDPAFLSEIQLFWERALLKSVLSKKSDELAALADVSEKEIRAYYQKNKANIFLGKELEQVRDQIKWFIIQEKQSGAMDEWGQLLKKKAAITVHYGRLGLQE